VKAIGDGSSSFILGFFEIISSDILFLDCPAQNSRLLLYLLSNEIVFGRNGDEISFRSLVLLF